MATSDHSNGPSPTPLSKSNSTSQCSACFRVFEPAKRTSSGFSALSSCGAMEPEAQTIASATFDLPEPFGPTTTATPGSSSISTGSTNDLKPRNLIARRCTRAQAIAGPGRNASVSSGVDPAGCLRKALLRKGGSDQGAARPRRRGGRSKQPASSRSQRARAPKARLTGLVARNAKHFARSELADRRGRQPERRERLLGGFLLGC